MEDYVKDDDNTGGFSNSGQAFEDDLDRITVIEENEEKEEDE